MASWFSTQVSRRLAKRIHKELFPGVPNPQAEVQALYSSVMSLKQGYEQLVRGRGDVGKSALLVEELSDILEELLPFLDGRYTQLPTELVDGIDELVDQIVAHMADENIHFPDAPSTDLYLRRKGGWSKYTAPTASWRDIINDGAVVLNKTWSSVKINNLFQQINAWIAQHVADPDVHHPQLHDLDSHTDVNAPAPEELESLIWDETSGKWINGEARHQLSEANPTGLAEGGELNIGPGPNDIEVIAGYGVVIDSYTDPLSRPTTQGLEWPQINEAITAAPAVAGSTVYFTIYDTGISGNPLNGRPLNVGALRQYDTPPSEPTRRDEIFLGVVVHNGDVWGEISSPIVINNAAHTLAEFLKRVAGPTFVIDGGTVAEAPAFTIDQDAGTIWEHNRNWHVNKKDPHREALPATTGLQWKYVNRDFTDVSTLTSTVEPTQYDDGGTVSPVPGNNNQCTIQQLYQDPRDNYWVLWGQQTFDNATEAAASVVALTEVPPLLLSSVLLGYIIVEKGKSDWDVDEAFILYPQGGGGTGGGGVPITTYLGLADTPGAYTGDARKVATVDDLESNLIHDYRSKYIPNYTSGPTYYPQEWVSNSSWIATANKITTEPAFPENVGSLQELYEDNPPFLEDSHVGQVRSGFLATFTKPGKITQLQVWIPEVTNDTNYTFVTINDPNGTPQLTRYPLRNENLTAGQWNTVTIGEAVFGIGQEALLYMEAHNYGGTTQVTGGWQYGGQDNVAAPATGGWNNNNAETILRIDKTDLDTTDRTTELLGIITGSTVQFAVTATPTDAKTYITLAAPVDQGTYIEYQVSLSSDVGSVDSGDVTTMTADVPVAQATKFVYELDKFLDYPDYADIVSELQYDGVSQGVPATTGYGINFNFQQLSQSADWDLIAIGGGGGGGGGDFTPTTFTGAGTTGYVPDPITEQGFFLADDGTFKAAGGGGSGFWAQNGLDIYNTNTGNVGIGTDSPTTTLEVLGRGTFNSSSLSLVVDSSRAGGGRVSTFKRSGSDGDILVLQLPASDALYFGGKEADSLSYIGLPDTNDLVFGGSLGSNERMRIASDGDIGFSRSPQTLANWLVLDIGDPSRADGSIIRMRKGDDLQGQLYVNADGFNLQGVGALPLMLHTNSVERMRITSDGKVGIGITSPTTELDVNGIVTATDFSGGGAGLTGVNAATLDSLASTQFLRSDASDTMTGNLTMNGNITLQDSHYTYWGTGNDCRMWFNGSHLYLDVGVVTTAANFYIRDGSTTRYTFADDGDLTLATGGIHVENGTVSNPSFSFGSDGNTGMYRTAADSIGLTTGGALRTTVNSTGLVVTGGVSVSGTNQFSFAGYGGGWNMQDTTWIRSQGAKRIYNSTNNTASFATPGDFTAAYSDMRLKTKTGDLDNALDKVCSLDTFLYRHNDLAKSLGYTEDIEMVGLSAQQLKEVLPQVISLAPVDMGEEDENGVLQSKSGENYMTAKYDRVVPLLVEAIKELREEIKELKNG